MFRAVFILLAVMASCAAPEQQGAVVPEERGASEVVMWSDSALYYLQKIDREQLSVQEWARAAEAFSLGDSAVKSAPENLMKAGLVCLADDEHRLYGVNYLILLTKKFPNDPYAPEALMQLALFYDNVMGDPEKSSQLLRKIVERYPEAQVRPDAERLLAMTGGEAASDLEMVKKWLKEKQ